MNQISFARRHAKRIVPALAMAAISLGAACAREMATAPRFIPTSHDIQGSWGATPTFPGIEFLMGLQESSGAVTGTGTFAGEAAPYGSLVVTGHATADSLHLQIVYNYDPIFTTLRPDTAQFSGALVSLDSMTGTFTLGGLSSATQYIRLKIGDPAP